MATEVPSQQELLELFKNEVQAIEPLLTDFEEGSINDALGGGFSVGGQELARLIIEKFNKTFFNTANGPEITGSVDDLQTLAKDHFGESFARPGAANATGTVTFTRPTGPDPVTIPAGTTVKTNTDAQGEDRSFTTDIEVTMGIGVLTIPAAVTAVEPGSESNVGIATVINIEDALTDDTVVVTNALAFVGGSPAQTDAEYREFIRNKVEVIRGATKAAIEAAATNVSGVEIATAIEDLQTVIEYDIGGGNPVGDFFFIPRVRLFIADSAGTASASLISQVEDAIFFVRACGVRIDVLAAIPLAVDWSALLTLDPGGPNFAEFSSDTSDIVATMEQYIRDLPIGTGFDRLLARAAILTIWGPAGTTDLTDFATTIPAGNISALATEKLIPGTVATT